MRRIRIIGSIGLVLSMAAVAYISRPLPVAHGTVVAAADLPSLVRMSEVIVVGTVMSDAGTRNTARDPNDLSRPHPELTANAHFYRVQVDTLIKGTTSGTVLVGSAESGSVPGALGRNEFRYENFIPLISGTRYVLMLRSDPFAPGSYSLSFEPSRFELGQMAVVRTAHADLRTRFPEVPADAFLDALRAAVAASR